MATPKLKLGNDKWATKQRSLLAYNDEGNNFKSIPFNVERLSGGSYVGRNGLIQYAATEEPRIDFTNYSKGALLLEPQRTNYCLNSNNASQWSTLTSNGTITRSANYATAPDGTQTATRLQASVTGSGYALLFPSTNSISGGYSLSVYVKSNTGSNQNVAFYGRNTALSTYTVTNEWQRLELSGSQTGGENSYFSLGVNTSVGIPDNPIDILVWGGQLEQGDYSTSYIPTAGSTATRVQEFIENRYTGLSSASGTIFIDLDTKGLDLSYSKIIALRDTVTGESLRLEPHLINGINSIAFFGINGNNPVPLPADTLPINNRKKIALTFSGSNFKYASNGVITTGTYTGTPRQYNQIGGANITGGAMHNGIIQDFRLYNEVLTDAQLQTLTTL